MVATLVEQATERIGRVRPGESAVKAAPNHNRPILLRCTEDVNHSIMKKETAPVAVPDMRDIDPVVTAVFLTVNAR